MAWRWPWSRKQDLSWGTSLAALLGGGETSAGVSVSDESAWHLATANACVRLIAQTVASLPLHVYRRLPDGGRERADPSHSLQRVLQRPNPWQTALEFREQLTTHVLVTGNAYAYISWIRVRDEAGVLRDVVAELLPLDPRAVTVEADDWRTVPRYHVRGRSGRVTVIPWEDMFHVRGISWTGLQGRALVEDCREAFGGALAAQEYTSRLMANDATPGVVLRHPARLSDQAATRLREQWDAAHAGSRRARRTAVLEDGMTIERVSFSAVDAQLMQLRAYQRSEICGLFGVPGVLVGVDDRAPVWGNGIEQLMIGFSTLCIRPMTRRWEQAIARDLIVRDQDWFVEHTVEDLLRGDVKTRYDAYCQAIDHGIMTANEVRQRENLPPMPVGDVLHRLASVVPMGDDRDRSDR